MYDVQSGFELAYYRVVCQIQDDCIKDKITKEECEQKLEIERLKYISYLQMQNRQLIAQMEHPRKKEVTQMKKYPMYVKTRDGYVGTFKRLEYGEFPVYRFDGGERMADNWEIEHGSNNKEDLK